MFVFERPDLDNFVLIFTMGKVGSTALIHSLEAVNVFCRHIQLLSPEFQKGLDQVPSDFDPIDLALLKLNVRRCSHGLADPRYASLVKVITAIRAPIDQIMSHYFHARQFWWRFMGNKPTIESIVEDILKSVELYLERPDMDLSTHMELRSRAFDQHLFFHFCVLTYTRWFESELRPVFPVDLLGGSMREGYQIADNVLVLKFEEIEPLGERAVSAFVQRPNFKYLRANVGADKDYGDVYRSVLEKIKFPATFVNHLCDLEIVRHFYSDLERRNMRTKWIA